MIQNYSLVDSISAADKTPVYPANEGAWYWATWTTIVTFLSTAFTHLTVSSYIKTTAVAVANLPSPATVGAGARSMVSDATATTFASVVSGGGANIVPVYSDGTNWRIG